MGRGETARKSLASHSAEYVRELGLKLACETALCWWWVPLREGRLFQLTEMEVLGCNVAAYGNSRRRRSRNHAETCTSSILAKPGFGGGSAELRSRNAWQPASLSPIPAQESIRNDDVAS